MSRIPGWLAQFSEMSKAPVRPWERGFKVISLFLMLLVPVGIWWVSRTPQFNLQPTTSTACPATTPVLVQDLLRHPERYRHRPIWITGQVVQNKPICLSLPCSKHKSKKPCCPPCHATLSLRQSNLRVPLRGRLGSKALLCSGTKCDLHCGSLVPGFYYALAGEVRVLPKPWRGGQPGYRISAFRVKEGCLLTDQNRERRKATPQKDPLHRFPKPRQM